jgi:hypothetical protein
MNKKNTVLEKLENFTIQNTIPIWPFHEKNAYLVTRIGIVYSDIFTLLTSNIFHGDLCLHKSIDEVDAEFNVLHFRDDELEDFRFFNLNLTQKQYYENYISIFLNYRQFLESAVLYYLKVSIEKNKVSSFMWLFSLILIANTTYTSVLYKDMKILNVFAVFTFECLQGFFSNFCDFTITSILKYENTNAFLTVERSNRLFRFLNMFSFHFSPKFRAFCFKDCMKTKTYIPMFLALKIYHTNLVFPKPTLKELNKIHSIYHFKTSVIAKNSISKKNMNQLIEKNWRYHNYK